MPDFNKVETEKWPSCLSDPDRQAPNFQIRFIGHFYFGHSKFIIRYSGFFEYQISHGSTKKPIIYSSFYFKAPTPHLFHTSLPKPMVQTPQKEFRRVHIP